MKSYILRKRKGKYEYVPIDLAPQYPENRKKFSHCGNCGSGFFKVTVKEYICRKCGQDLDRMKWEFVK